MSVTSTQRIRIARFDIRGRTWCAAAVLCAGVALGSTQALAQCIEQQKLIATDAAMNDQFGRSVSISGSLAMVGSFGDDCVGPGSNCGSVYVYRRSGDTWTDEVKLFASDVAAGDQFGRAVFVNGDVAIISSRLDDCSNGDLDCGAVYIFRFDGATWNEEQKLTASDPGVDDNFGDSLAIEGNLAIVGARDNDCIAGIDCGSAYVFRFNGTSWNEEQKLTANDEAANDRFGNAVSLANGKAIVGAPRHNDGAGSQSGAVYVFSFDGSTWTQDQELTASDAANGDNFGQAVSGDGESILIGAMRDKCADNANACGSVYVFAFNGVSWQEEQKLTASDASEGDNFGHAVSLDLNRAVIGAYLADCAAGVDCGAAYVFEFDGGSWSERRRLAPTDGETTDWFGFAVSISADTAFLGSRQADCDAGGNCGAAYVFRCFPPGSVPATSTWGLASLTLLLLGVGTVVIRRKTTALGLD